MKDIICIFIIFICGCFAGYFYAYCNVGKITWQNMINQATIKLEKVARAICLETKGDPNKPSVRDGNPQWMDYIRVAQVAIEAMDLKYNEKEAQP